MTKLLSKVFNLRTIFLVDASAFLLGSIIVMFFSSPERGLTNLISTSGLLALEDTRKWLAAQFFTVSIFLWLFFSKAVDDKTRILAARLRCLSLIVMFSVHVYFLFNGRWVSSWITTPMIAFTLLFIGYFYFSVISPKKD